MNQYILEIYNRIHSWFEWFMFRTGPSLSDKDSDDGDIEQQEQQQEQQEQQEQQQDEQTILLYRK